MLPIFAILLIISVTALLYIRYDYNKLYSKYYALTEEPQRLHDQVLSTSDITHDRLTEMEARIDNLPNKVLESINGSISNKKGKLAELIAYVNLTAGYDKVIPLGNIVDFIGIKFPSETEPGTFDFIDVKNGKSARLSQDQKQLQKLIQAQRIQFLKINITTDNVADLPTDPISGTDTNI
jgi:predicted Holliday junction resolvase-like endonuclease